MKTDTQLQDDVIAELKWEPSIHASQIGVQVRDGIVTLAGTVSSYAQKLAAEQAAQRVVGVKALAIDMRVKLSELGSRTDSDIARSVENVLEWTTPLPRDAVKVMVEAGWITLTGEVDWQFQKELAQNAVRHLVGVTGVSNDISLNLTASVGAVKSDIVAALNRRSRSDAKNIEVDVHGADVTLTGTVNSWTERDLATHTAWGSPGVRNVVDKLTIAF